VLKHWDLSDRIHLTAIGGGINSTVWTVKAGDTTWIAKVAHTSALHPGLEVAEFLATRDFASGAPLRNRSGDLTVGIAPETEVAVLRFVPGRSLGSSDEDVARRGRALGRLHRLLLELPSGEIKRRWPWDWLTDFDQLRVGSRLRHAIGDAVRRTEDLVAGYGVTFGVLHGDAAGSDFLFDDANEQLGVVDWGAVAQGPLLYDIGTVCALRQLEDERRRRFLAAYLSEAPVPAEELDHLDQFVRLRWAVQARYFSWRIARRIRTGIASDHENRRGLVDAIRALGLSRRA
jgi:homoserine kinase type II